MSEKQDPVVLRVLRVLGKPEWSGIRHFLTGLGTLLLGWLALKLGVVSMPLPPMVPEAPIEALSAPPADPSPVELDPAGADARADAPPDPLGGHPVAVPPEE